MFPPSSLPVPLAGGAYRLVRVLGQGGMAVVYEALVDLERFDFAFLLAHAEPTQGDSRRLRQVRQEDLHQELLSSGRGELEERCRARGLAYPAGGRAAVKVLRPGTLDLERFEGEWRNLMAIVHPHVVSVYGGGFDEPHGLHWYAMELVETIVRGPAMLELPLAAKLELVLQAAAGLECLHGRRLVHRDVKPDNLICSRGPHGGVTAKLCDLGIAKDFNLTLALTQHDHAMGSPNFMAPEQADSPRHATPASDVYSLGATLYFLLCGSFPYQGSGLFQVLRLLSARQPPVPPQQHAGGMLPAALDDLVRRTMSFEPARRPSLREVGRALHDYLCGAPTEDLSRPWFHVPTPIGQLATERVAKRSILVVEDDPQLRRLLDRWLSEKHEVCAAGDGADALLQLGYRRFDLVVTDVEMPHLGGLQLLAILRQKGIEVPVICMSGSPEPDLAERVRSLGARVFLAKPLAMEDLLLEVERILAVPASPGG